MAGILTRRMYAGSTTTSTTAGSVATSSSQDQKQTDQTTAGAVVSRAEYDAKIQSLEKEIETLRADFQRAMKTIDETFKFLSNRR